MSIRIVTEAEMSDALREAEWYASERDHALNELAALREWFSYPPEQKAEWGDPRYPLELIDEIERAVRSWPVLTLEQLVPQQ